ncbi:hypothetical protein GH714_008219 [Hevea brasiliensis]|uniref:Mitochondrial import inner membrane translocase subunit TIM50 n=1 Tax=Hevea brasiliensis TaxID=3981 RepID=A0A6A6KKU5_HEVBR|nr:hypothetical protein GH714_008219 [Hevea brasiliensis]
MERASEFVRVFVAVGSSDPQRYAFHGSDATLPLPVVEIPLQETSIAPQQTSVPTEVSKADSGYHRMEKLTVVLDLDETLVSACETSSLPTSIRNLAIEAGLKWKTKINYVTVFERPGLHEFLKQISEFADLVLFTAGLEGYAGPLVDRIDVEKRFSLRLYRPSTVSTCSKRGILAKDTFWIVTSFVVVAKQVYDDIS